MTASKKALLAVTLGIVAANAALAGFFVATSGFVAAIPVLASTGAVLLITLLLAGGGSSRSSVCK